MKEIIEDTRGRIPLAELTILLRALDVRRSHQVLLGVLGLGGVTVLGWWGQ